MSTNPPRAQPDRSATVAAAPSHRPIAPAWHTILFLAVIFSFAALSAHSQAQMVQRRGRVTAYLLTLTWEWVLLGYVLWGTRKRNIGLRELAGGTWNSAKDVLTDIAIVFGFWIVAGGALAALSFAFGLGSPSQVAAAKKQLGPLMPASGREIVVWLALSATAGFCEEILFRGYLQRQFRAATRSTSAGVILQAVVFGVAHAYQGSRRIVLIAVYGVLFGILAAWRKSLRPGMIAHAVQDSFSGIAFRLLK